MDKRFWAIMGVIAVVVVGGIWLNNKKPSAGGTPTDHIVGKGTTGVKLEEYGDYECPFCGQYYAIVKAVVAEYSDQITFQFRNLPLTQLHPNAFASARAAEAAGLQGKFWEMHDMLYANQSQWVNSSAPASMFATFAQAIGLNVTQFKSDYVSDKVNGLINADVSAFNKTGAQEATPTFFLDGKQVQPNESVASFEQILNNAITQKGFTPKPNKTNNTAGGNANSAPRSKQ